ncbi:hypothetical protein PFZ55_43340 [Streptomyces sp. MS2A]|nr:hypothetical protein [Streptomyces sp. MS2A]
MSHLRDSEPEALHRAHRTVRTLNPGEGPFPGRLVTDAREEVRVCTDAAGLVGWSGWRYAGAEHIVGPVDLLRRSDGHDVLLPWCVQTVEQALRMRRAGEAPLAAGETTTLVASVLRGLVEAGEDTLSGGWWLTADGRPMFVIGRGSSIEEATRGIIDALASQARDRALGRLLQRIGEGLGDDRRRLPHRAGGWERELLEIAAPKPLGGAGDCGVGVDAAVLQSPTPARVRDLRRAVEEDARARSLVAEDHALPSRSRRPRLRFLRRASDDLGAGTWSARRGSSVSPMRPGDVLRAVGARMSSALGRLRRPRTAVASAPERRWRRPVLAAAVVAVAVSAAGMLWPSAPSVGGTEPPPEASTPSGNAGSSVPGASPAADAEKSLVVASPSPMPEETASPLGAVPALLSAAEACEATALADACAGAWVPELRDTGSPGTGRAIAVDGDAVLIEDYGDVAAVRLDREGGASQMLVIVRTDDGWRIRDAYDVGDPPSEEAGPEGQTPS